MFLSAGVKSLAEVRSIEGLKLRCSNRMTAECKWEILFCLLTSLPRDLGEISVVVR